MKQFKLLLYLGLFIGLTLVGVFWSIRHYQLDVNLLLGFSQLSVAGIIVLFVLYLLLYVTDIWRYQVLARALGQTIRFKTGVEVSIANDFFSWITPGAALGAPAAIYVLAKKGMAWDVASIICFAKSMLGAGLLVLMALVILILDLGPPMPSEWLALLIWGFTIILLVIGIPIVAAMRLSQTLTIISQWRSKLNTWKYAERKSGKWLAKLIDVFQQSVERLAKFESSWRQIIAVSLIHLPYLLVFTGMLSLLLWEFTGSFSLPAFLGSLDYIAFTYVAPTPGAAGLSEASAASFFSQVATPAQALIAVLLFRASTVYLHIVVGLIYISYKSGVIIVLRGNR